MNAIGQRDVGKSSVFAFEGHPHIFETIFVSEGVVNAYVRDLVTGSEHPCYFPAGANGVAFNSLKYRMSNVKEEWMR